MFEILTSRLLTTSLVLNNRAQNFIIFQVIWTTDKNYILNYTTANSVDPDVAAHYEPSQIELHCLLVFLIFSHDYTAWTNFFESLQTYILSSISALKRLVKTLG